MFFSQEEEEEEEEEDETEEDAMDRIRNDMAEVYDNDTNRLANVQVTYPNDIAGQIANTTGIAVKMLTG